jgi:hypothetical protein
MLSLHILLGRGATIAGLGKRELPLATRKDDNAHFDYIFCDKGREVDSVAESYLQDLLENVREAGGGTLVPIAVEVKMSAIKLANMCYQKLTRYLVIVSYRAMVIV